MRLLLGSHKRRSALALLSNDQESLKNPLLRAAVFTSDTPEDRDQIFQLLKTAYDLRSKLATGKNASNEGLSVTAPLNGIFPMGAKN